MGFLSRLTADLLGLDRRPPNAFMWRGEHEPFYHRWWLKLNAENGDAYSLQVVVNNPWDTGGRYELTGVYIFFDRYSRVAERNLMTMTEWPLDTFKASTDAFAVEVDGNIFNDRTFKGAIHDPDHDVEITFDLEITQIHSFLLTELGVDGMAQGRFFNTLWQAPLLDGRVSGTIALDDDIATFDAVPAYQDTFYGSSVPDRWFWGQCNRFTEDASASIVLGSGQFEILGQKIPRFLEGESFPLVAVVRLGEAKLIFNSLFHPTEYRLDKGRIRLESRQRWRRVRLVYESSDDATLRAMDWHSPDDTNLESTMTLIAPATLELYRRSFFGPWRLEAKLSTPNAAAICGGAKMDRISVRHPFLRTVARTLFLFAYVGLFYLRGLLGRR